MKRIAVALLLLSLPWRVALAQGPAPVAVAPAVAPLTAAQSQQALEVLRDPARRAQLIGVLEAIAKAAPAGGLTAPVASTPAASPPASPPASPAEATPDAAGLKLAPDSVGAQLIVDASARLSRLTEDVILTARTITDFPLLMNFLEQLVNDQWSRNLMFETAWRLALVMAGGLAAQSGIGHVLARPMRALARRRAEAEPDPAVLGIAAAEAGQSELPAAPWPSPLAMLRRVPRAAGRLVLLLLPVIGFLATCYALLGVGLGDQPIARLVILGFMNAYAVTGVAIALLHALAGPGRPSLFRPAEATAHYLLRWTRRIAVVGIFGYTLAEVGLLFGLFRIAHDALLKLVVLVIYVFLCVIILQNRVRVAGLIRARADAVGPVAVLRNRVAGLWHLVAIFYVLALWAVWALAVPDGFTRLLRVVVLTGLVLVAARQVVAVTHATLARWTHMPADLSGRYPDLDQRLAAYHPIARGVIHAAMWGVAGVAILEIWSIDAFGWFTTGHVGARLLSALGTIGATLLAGVLVWEALNAAIRRHLDQLTREAQLARSARLRTLLPMLRTALFATISLVTGLMVLSEIGVNIAPLLAGAGVVGVAIAFGSQKLVQDVITGLFLLLENAMQVGDAVTLGGYSGSVEALSVRTIRLRAVDGSVHLIPFSAVTTVTNMTRDFGFAVIEVPIGLDEDQDRVTLLLREIANGLRGEEKWREAIREDIEIFGLDKFVAGAFVLQARMKTTAGQRWAVRRELNRRIKQRFDELAIDSPLTSYRVLKVPAPTVVGVLDTRG